MQVKRTGEARNSWALWETAATAEGTDTDSSETLWYTAGTDRKLFRLYTWDETHFHLSQEERGTQEAERRRVERFLQSRRTEFKVTFLLSSDRPFAYLSVDDRPELATVLSSRRGQRQAWDGTKNSHLLKDTFGHYKGEKGEVLAPCAITFQRSQEIWMVISWRRISN